MSCFQNHPKEKKTREFSMKGMSQSLPESLQKPAPPIIDVSALLKDEDESSSCVDRRNVVLRNVHDACRDTGCFYISGHGVSEKTTNTVLEAARLFFDLPFEKKIALDIRNSKAYRGYIQKGSEMTDGKIDVKEGIYFGPDVSANDPDVICGTPMVGPNQFPDEADLPGFSTTIKQYKENMKSVGLSLMRAIAMGLELEETYFDSVFAVPCAWMATWHYPPHPCENESWGVGPHTDHEVITILLQDDVGGLQIQTADGTWIDVPPILGTFVVIVGDALEAWTKGLYHATLHRVKTSPYKHRYSAPFFYAPNPKCLIEPLDSVLTRDLSYTPELLLQLPFRFGGYYHAKFQMSFDWYSKEM